MTQQTQTQSALNALASIKDPLLKRELSTKEIKNLRIEEDKLSVEIQLPYPAKSLMAEFSQELKKAALSVSGIKEVEITITCQIVAHAVQRGVQLLGGVKNIIGVASGKGGVGKSTTAVNIALALSKEGARVAILDSDIYGPSVPLMMGAKDHGQPEIVEEKYMKPAQAFGVKLMSIGFLAKDDQAMIWRGPMAVQALDQMLRQTAWGEIDYLIIDMPPGTGDIQLSLAQRVPMTGAVIVTTPQDVALLDAKKGVAMFEKVNVPVFGLVENMAMHTCENCGHIEHIFGKDGGRKYAQEKGIDYLGALPLSLAIREKTDQGCPTVESEPESEAAKTYTKIAHQVAAKIAGLGKDFSSKFPAIVVSNT